MKNIITLLLVLSTSIILAQDSLSSKLSLEGSIDTYYKRNLSTNTDLAPATSLANGNGFSLGTVSYTHLRAHETDS